MLFFIHDSKLSAAENFKMLAASYGDAVIENNRFFLPPKLGSGTMMMQEISPDLTIGVLEYTCYKRSFMGIKRSDNERYYLAFSTNKLAANTTQDTGW